jgi:hypothetical protein
VETNTDGRNINLIVVLTSYTVSFLFDVELRLSPRWVGANIGSTGATKICHNLKAYIFDSVFRFSVSRATCCHNRSLQGLKLHKTSVT